MFKVTVRVHGHMKEYLPAQSCPLEVRLAEPRTVREVLDQLGINHELVMTAFVNGERASMGSLIDRDSELLIMSPPAGGGSD